MADGAGPCASIEAELTESLVHEPSLDLALEHVLGLKYGGSKIPRSTHPRQIVHTDAYIQIDTTWRVLRPQLHEYSTYRRNQLQP